MNEADLFMKQAPMTAHTYLSEAVKSIDQTFGEGYAKEHPELVGAFIQTCAIDFLAGWLAQEIKSAIDPLAAK